MIAKGYYDYIFAGKGASASLVLIELERQNLLHSKRIVIVEPNHESKSSKNFCFWTDENGEIKRNLAPLIQHSWCKIHLNNGKQEQLTPTSYNHIPNSIIIEKANEIIQKHHIHLSKPIQLTRGKFPYPECFD